MIWDERLEESLRNHDAYENGKDEGFYNGVEQKQTEMIMNMYNKKMLLEDISEISNISLEEVQSIIKNNTENN